MNHVSLWAVMASFLTVDGFVFPSFRMHDSIFILSSKGAIMVLRYYFLCVEGFFDIRFYSSIFIVAGNCRTLGQNHASQIEDMDYRQFLSRHSVVAKMRQLFIC